MKAALSGTLTVNLTSADLVSAMGVTLHAGPLADSTLSFGDPKEVGL